MEHIRDTVVISANKDILVPLVPAELESLGVFVMLTEASRRDRNRRVDLGDESAKLKLTFAAGWQRPATSGTGASYRPPLAAGILPGQPFKASW